MLKEVFQDLYSCRDRQRASLELEDHSMKILLKCLLVCIREPLVQHQLLSMQIIWTASGKLTHSARRTPCSSIQSLCNSTKTNWEVFAILSYQTKQYYTMMILSLWAMLIRWSVDLSPVIAEDAILHSKILNKQATTLMATMSTSRPCSRIRLVTPTLMELRERPTRDWGICISISIRLQRRSSVQKKRP